MARVISPGKNGAVPELPIVKRIDISGSGRKYMPTTKTPIGDAVDPVQQAEVEEIKRVGTLRDISEKTALDLNNVVPISKSIDEVTNFQRSVPITQTGPIGGRMKEVPIFGEYLVEARQADSATKVASQNYGRFMEGGVLRKEDEIKYYDMFPQIKDPLPLREFKAQNVKRSLIVKFNNDLETLKAAGFDTRGIKVLKVPELPKIGKAYTAQIQKAVSATDSMLKNAGMGLWKVNVEGVEKIFKAKSSSDATKLKALGAERIE